MNQKEGIKKLAIPVTEAQRMELFIDGVFTDYLSNNPDVTEVHFIYPVERIETGEKGERAKKLLERIDIWTKSDLEHIPGDIDVFTSVVWHDEYLFSPSDYADAIHGYCERENINGVLISQDYSIEKSYLGIMNLRTDLEAMGLEVDVFTTRRTAMHTPLLTSGGFKRYFLIFAVSLAFYFSIGSLSVFNIVTGIASAAVVSAILYKLVFEFAPSIGRTLTIIGRMMIYLPIMFYEIIKANFDIAYVVLHPRCPIDPGLQRINPALWGGFANTTLANSISLTPGTLTVEAKKEELLIHTMTQDARDSIKKGVLEKLVVFVFYGREAMKIPTPDQRGDYETVEGPDK